MTHTTEDLTEALQNPDPSSPILHLREKQTVSLNKLEVVFNMAVPQAPSPPPAKLPGVEQTL